MIAWPQTAWPTRSWPLNGWPDDGRSYRIYKRTTRTGADVLVATLAPGTSEYLITGGAPHSEAWYFARAVSQCGVEDIEPVGGKLVRVAFDAAGELILPVPNAPTGLSLVRREGGGVTARWGYQPLHEGVAPATFNVYLATGATAFNYAAADHQVTAGGGRSYAQDLGTFAHGTTVRVVVRSVSAAGSEESNVVEVEAIADAEAPAAPASLTVEVA